MILTKLILNAEISKLILPEKIFSKKITASLFHVYLLSFTAVEVRFINNVERFITLLKFVFKLLIFNKIMIILSEI